MIRHQEGSIVFFLSLCKPADLYNIMQRPVLLHLVISGGKKYPFSGGGYAIAAMLPAAGIFFSASADTLQRFLHELSIGLLPLCVRHLHFHHQQRLSGGGAVGPWGCGIHRKMED